MHDEPPPPFFCVFRKDKNSEIVPQSSRLRKRMTSVLCKQGRRSLVGSLFPVTGGLCFMHVKYKTGSGVRGRHLR